MYLQITQEQARQFLKLSGTRDLNSRNPETARQKQSPYNRIVRLSGLGRPMTIVDFVVFQPDQIPSGDPDAQGYYGFYIASPGELEDFIQGIKKQRNNMKLIHINEAREWIKKNPNHPDVEAVKREVDLCDGFPRGRDIYGYESGWRRIQIMADNLTRIQAKLECQEVWTRIILQSNTKPNGH